MGSMAEAATTPEKETETVAVEGMVALPASAPASVPTVQPNIAGGGERRPGWQRSWLASAGAAREACPHISWGWIEKVDGAHPWGVRPHRFCAWEGATASRYIPPIWAGPYAVSTRRALQQSWSQIPVGPTSTGTQFIPKPGMASWRLQTGVTHQYQSPCQQTFGRFDDVQRGFEVHPCWASWRQWEGDSSYQWWLWKVDNSRAGDIVAWERDSRSWIPTWISTCTNCCTTNCCTTICGPIICCTTTSNAGGTICDIDIWNARVYLELCGCTAQYSSDTTSGTQGTSGIVDFYATCSNWGRNGIESATITAFDFDGGRWIRTAPQGCSIADEAPSWKQTFRELPEWIRVGLHSPRWWISQKVARWISSKVSLVWRNQKLLSFLEWNHSCLWAE